MSLGVQKCLNDHDKSFAPFRKEALSQNQVGQIPAEHFYLLARQVLLKEANLLNVSLVTATDTDTHRTVEIGVMSICVAEKKYYLQGSPEETNFSQSL